jgi:hypothetical protein
VFFARLWCNTPLVRRFLYCNQPKHCVCWVSPCLGVILAATAKSLSTVFFPVCVGIYFVASKNTMYGGFPPPRCYLSCYRQHHLSTVIFPRVAVFFKLFTVIILLYLFRERKPNVITSSLLRLAMLARFFPFFFGIAQELGPFCRSTVLTQLCPPQAVKNVLQP